MPHLVAFVRRVNRLLDPEEPDGHGDLVRSGLREAATISEAADIAGLIDDGDGDLRAVLTSLSPSVDAALLASLRSAVDRNLPVVVQWKPGATVELEVWEAVDDGVGQVGVLITTPYGRVLAAE